TRARWPALASGVAASLAILTRPNLVPLLVVVFGIYLVELLRADGESRPARIRDLIMFDLGAWPGCLAVALANHALYGSPLRSGYEGFAALFAWTNAVPNLARYPKWMVETQTPAIALALAAPFVTRRGWSLLVFVAIVFLSYLFYVPFGSDEWGYL